MREIKFRGRDGDDWYYGSLFVNECGHTAISALKSFWMKPVYAETVGQFTGLLDSAGEEIYEGDILFNSRERYVVKFKKEWAAYIAYGLDELDNGGKNFLLDEVVNTPIDRLKPKIIGNLYDNPELLEAQNARD